MGNHYFLKRMFKNTVGKYEQQRSEKEKKNRKGVSEGVATPQNPSAYAISP